MAIFKDGVIWDGAQPGYGNALGNVKNGVISEGGQLGYGNALGNVKDGVISEGGQLGYGNVLFNIKDGDVRIGASRFNDMIGKVSDFKIEGMEREPEAEVVAAYHFLVKKII